MSLCWRCQNRVNFIEYHARPRNECGLVHMSVESCYMFQPVKPIVVEKSFKDDTRPISGSMMGSRMSMSKRQPALKAKLWTVGKQILLGWVPEKEDGREKAKGHK